MSNTLTTLINKFKGTPAPLMAAFVAPPAGAGTPIVLAFNMQRQTQTQWCWAASSTSVSLFYNPSSPWTQCLVAGQALTLNCCISPGPCNQPWFLDRALTITGNFAGLVYSPLSFIAIEAELNAGRVIGTRIGWAGGGGHFMAIYGCDGSGPVNYLNIDDPIYGKSFITETTFLSHYQGSGSWTHSYNTKP